MIDLTRYHRGHPDDPDGPTSVSARSLQPAVVGGAPRRRRKVAGLAPAHTLSLVLRGAASLAQQLSISVGGNERFERRLRDQLAVRLLPAGE